MPQLLTQHLPGQKIIPTVGAMGSLNQSRYSMPLLVLILLLNACTASQPADITDVCDIFEDRISWYRAARSSEARWGIPIAVNMAFIYQESSFRARARPNRTRILWLFPGPRESSAYGYAQALDSTWAEYQRKSGNRWSTRRNFGDAIDFVAWYNASSHRQSKIAKHDARNLYLAYHEGNGGFQRGSYRGKSWLLTAADNVQSNANRFDMQLDECRDRLNRNWLVRLLF